jgi:murein DD-endopeptidase MepM/ murein hydrolase activator NlpD
MDPPTRSRREAERDNGSGPDAVDLAELERDEDDDLPLALSRPRRVSRRPFPRPPANRLPLVLVALVVGALFAGFPGVLVGAEPPVASASAADYGLGMASESSFGSVDAGARPEITEAEAATRLQELAASRAARAPKFFLPVDGTMTTCFCQRWGSMHWGVDLAAPLGTPILAASDGVVIKAGPVSGYGNAIYVQDADENVQIYGHMRHLFVTAGDVISAGDPIAKVGNEGFSTGPHLHFEIHQGSLGGKPIDPATWLADRGAPIRR